MTPTTVLEMIALIEATALEIRRDDAAAFARLDAAMEDIRTALIWAVAQPDKTLALRLAGPLWRYWDRRSRGEEGQRWLEQALAGSDAADPALRAQALDGAGVMAMDLGQYAKAQAFHEAALAFYQAHNDQPLIAGNLESLGLIAMLQDDYAGATRLLEQSLAIRQTLGAVEPIISTLLNLASVATCRHDAVAAHQYGEQAFAYGDAGLSDHMQLHRLSSAAMIAFEAQDYARVTALSRDTLRRSVPGEPRQILHSLEGLAAAAIEVGDPAYAACLYGAAERVYLDTGIPVGQLGRTDRPERLARGQAQLGAEAWAAEWAMGRQMDPAAILSFVEAQAAA